MTEGRVRVVRIARAAIFFLGARGGGLLTHDESPGRPVASLRVGEGR